MVLNITFRDVAFPLKQFFASGREKRGYRSIPARLEINNASAEVLHEYQLATCLIDLRTQDPSAIRRES
jgi:hypothetical protein